MHYLIGFFDIFPSQTRYVEVEAKTEQDAIERAWEQSNISAKENFIVGYVEELPYV